MSEKNWKSTKRNKVACGVSKSCKQLEEILINSLKSLWNVLRLHNSVNSVDLVNSVKK